MKRGHLALAFPVPKQIVYDITIATIRGTREYHSKVLRTCQTAVRTCVDGAQGFLCFRGVTVLGGRPHALVN